MNHPSRSRTGLSFCLVAAILFPLLTVPWKAAARGGSGGQPTFTPTRTNTPLNTPTKTRTPTPTKTPSPTNTPTPTETPTPTKDCCERAKDAGLDNGDGGGVICCDGQQITCWWNVPDAPGDDILRQCIIEHEEEHLDCVPTCDPNGSGISRPGFSPDCTPVCDECDAYQTELECLNNSISDCASLDPTPRAQCEDWVHARQTQVATLATCPPHCTSSKSLREGPTAKSLTPVPTPTPATIVQVTAPKGSSEVPVVSYYVERGYPAPGADTAPALVVNIWEDGRTIWSEDTIHGGPPYFEGSVSPENIQSLMEGYISSGYFQSPELRRIRSGHGSSRTHIVLSNGTRNLSLQSWHEVAEYSGKVIATANGLLPAEGRTWEDILPQEPEDYVFFRLVWEQVRGDILDLLPPPSKESRRPEGEVEFETRWITLGSSPETME